ncbi:deoxynucleotidyltransferase terminal-interacting protein 2 [Suncus etruscus]|uniref:deoxynucleotidyltransferase terminal-interacting protein 2 n=1 Tax=Suncus etruscus TaxID=109475 RepID=UPI00210FCC9B|nr:deoxynucleotidyltransferase terminal-interacting protein 2 [Suncus etruscus]
MVLTRSARPPATRQVVPAGNSRQKNTSAKTKEVNPKNENESEPDDPSTDELQDQTTERQSPTPRTPPKSRKRKSRNADPLLEKTKPSTDGEISEAESECSSETEVQETILRVTRRRQILVVCTPSVRKKVKDVPKSESNTEEVSDAESHVSGVSRVTTPTVKTTRTRKNKTKSVIEPRQESNVETISVAESSCSDASTCSGIEIRRTTRSVQRKLQSQTEEKNTMVLRNEKHIKNVPLDSGDSVIGQTFHDCDFDNKFLRRNSGEKLIVHKCQSLTVGGENKAADPAPKEITNQNSKSLYEESKESDEKEVSEKNSWLKSPSELQNTRFQQLISQRHSTPQNSKTTSESSNSDGAIMKSLAKTFETVEMNGGCDERMNTMKSSDLKELDMGESDEEERTMIAVSKDTNEEKVEERDADLECNTKLYNLEWHTPQEKEDSVLLVLSSDESQQSEDSEDEEDTVCFVDSCGQQESLIRDSENTSCDNSLFVIDKTPGLSSDKNFYLDEKDKASEIASEEGSEEEEDGKSEESSSDHEKSKDSEFSDEDDLLSNTKSKLLKLTSSSIDPGLSIKQLGGLYININANKLQSNKKTLTQIKEKKKNELLQKAVITPDFEKNYTVPPYHESQYQLQKKRRKERQKTAGDGWFGMKAPELTDELKNDLKALKMRASMDPKRFYKKNDRDGFPKYFQIGTIADNPADFYHSRIPKKERKRTIVEELLADSEFRRYNRKKYSEIMAEKTANAAGKKFRKKKKFRN